MVRTIKIDGRERKCVYERYTDIGALIRTIEYRRDHYDPSELEGYSREWVDEANACFPGWPINIISKFNTGSSAIRSWEDVKSLMLGDAKFTLQRLNCDSISSRKQYHTVPDVCGYAPIVPLYLTGHPLSMTNRVRMYKPSRAVNLVIDITGNCGLDSKEMNAAGEAIANAIMSIEGATGTRVGISILMAVDMHEAYEFMMLDTKSADAPAVKKRIIPPIAEVSYFRVLGFNWMVTNTEGSCHAGLGSPLINRIGSGSKLNSMVNELYGNNAIYISRNDFLGKTQDETNKLLEEAIASNRDT